jgi:hypothetical protein
MLWLAEVFLGLILKGVAVRELPATKLRVLAVRLNSRNESARRQPQGEETLKW